MAGKSRPEASRSSREGRSVVVDRTGLEEAIRRSADPVVLTQRVADEAMTLVAAADGVLVGFVHAPSWLTFDCGAGKAGVAGRQTGYLWTEVSRGSRSGRARLSTPITPRATLAFEPDFRRTAGFQSLVCVPLWRRAQAAGVLCVASFRSWRVRRARCRDADEPCRFHQRRDHSCRRLGGRYRRVSLPRPWRRARTAAPPTTMIGPPRNDSSPMS